MLEWPWGRLRLLLARDPVSFFMILNTLGTVIIALSILIDGHLPPRFPAAVADGSRHLQRPGSEASAALTMYQPEPLH
ncbi:hypothetical protein X772_34960 [Mesorhizobium sp. LSJC280B00]|nr:hypothetical protein X772_34960 [Mesorhizobium sp. LSJC280B00]